MGYFLLVLALLAGLTKGYCGKRMSASIQCGSDSMAVNVFRMLLCILIGLVMMLLQNQIGAIFPEPLMLLIAVLAGVSSASFVVLWLLCVRQSAYMMLEVFLLLGVTVPIILCRIFFGEQIRALQVFGILLLAVSVLIMCTYNVSIKGKIKPVALLLLLLCGLSSGITDFSQKLFVKNYPDTSIAAFNFYTYIFAAIILIFACIFFRRADQRKIENLRTPWELVKLLRIYVIVMAICLFANAYFKTQAAQYLDAVYMYPLFQGGGVAASLLMSSIFFKERINAKCLVGISLAFLSLMLINFL